MDKKKFAATALDYLIITFGLFIYAFAVTVFVLPNHLVSGGVSGIGAMIQYLTGFPISYSYFLINIVLLIIGMKVLGKGFGVKTIYAIVVCSALFKLLPTVIPQEFLNEMGLVANGKFICCLLGGILTGAGIGITFMRGGSSGGTDIIALIVNHYRNISTGTVILSLDIIICGCAIFLPTAEGGWAVRIANMIYSYILVAACSFTIDFVAVGSKSSVQIMVFSKQYEAIARRVAEEAHRGVTMLDSEGWYTKENSKVLVIITRKRESKNIMKIIKEEDSSAFCSVCSVKGVFGRGFEQYKK